MKYFVSTIMTAGIGVLLAGCTSQELPDAGGGVAILQPDFLTGTTGTRSLVNGIASGTGNGNIHQVNLYVTKSADNTVYPGITFSSIAGLSQFTYGGANWEGDPTVNLHNEKARIYAYYPVNVNPTYVAGGTQHTIPVSISADQTFDGANTWNCSVTDYLYGSAQQATDSPITASNQSFKPSIWMRHALAQVVFKMQSRDGRPVDAHDYIKKITMSTTGGTHFSTGTGTMLINDGTMKLSVTDGKTLSFTPSANPVQCGANSSPKVVAYGLVAPLSSKLANVSLSIELAGEASADNKRVLAVTSTTFNVKWEKGKRYIYNLTLTDRDIVVGDITITSWTPETGSDELRPDGF